MGTCAARPKKAGADERGVYHASLLHNKYRIEGKSVGEGRAGHVYRAFHRGTGELYAVKAISKLQQSSIECRREVEILRRIRGSPSIIHMMDVFEDSKGLFLVTEWCGGGELYDQIVECSKTELGRFTELQAATIMKQILSGVECLHAEHMITHRDLKPENFLLKRKGDISQIRIIDFGLSRFFHPKERLRTRVGTVYYTAPEVWNENYDNSCDLWSAGVVMYVLLASYPPFDGDSDQDILRSVMRSKYSFPSPEWDEISPEAKSLIRKLLAKNPARRPTATDVLRDRWFSVLRGSPRRKSSKHAKAATGPLPQNKEYAREFAVGDRTHDQILAKPNDVSKLQFQPGWAQRINRSGAEDDDDEDEDELCFDEPQSSHRSSPASEQRSSTNEFRTPTSPPNGSGSSSTKRKATSGSAPPSLAGSATKPGLLPELTRSGSFDTFVANRMDEVSSASSNGKVKRSGEKRRSTKSKRNSETSPTERRRTSTEKRSSTEPDTSSSWIGDFGNFLDRLRSQDDSAESNTPEYEDGADVDPEVQGLQLARPMSIEDIRLSEEGGLVGKRGKSDKRRR